ncbi:helix-turn-helix transcriptional regulator [Aquibium microcysteis]|uniref:helix-turn-helix transcriptional regulator n=1 Tax=Aquibium microcysteis TaxID=675281 RepID=UPI00165CF979|nr:LuxR C-terminal-related transcriptional regulator [Aquibium microcysteis]
MIVRLPMPEGTERRATTLAALIVVQALCAVFFLADVIVDFGDDGRLEGAHVIAEAVATAALIGGVAFLMIELRRLLGRMERMEIGLRSARGEMAAIVEMFFERWMLSPAERDVALLILKGIDTETIAAMRGTAKGTVRAQSAAIYAKAGVDGRGQFVSLFLEELLADDGRPPVADPSGN